ncbi:palindromic element RPE1 domain-containing protein [Candidatus Tisiphia endosymbiont of Empis tessellata]|uniref:palindromic element RPE1 domain-containing protein n=1 Tax=Candidatus Tisiphia endosymbiont of Empis tessellata TaxID=3066259 RepID=UPI00313C9485
MAFKNHKEENSPASLRGTTLVATKQSNRPLSKLACAEGFEGDASPRTAAYSNFVTDSSVASTTYKSPTEVEFRRRSNKYGLPRSHTFAR